jgi:hypothetical protein
VPKNPILDELHATREKLLAESGGSLAGLMDRLRAEQAASGRPAYNPGIDISLKQNGGTEELPALKQAAQASDK